MMAAFKGLHRQHQTLSTSMEMKDDSLTWACSACTFLNQSNVNQCKICGSKRGQKRKVDDLHYFRTSPSKKFKSSQWIVRNHNVSSHDLIERTDIEMKDSNGEDETQANDPTLQSLSQFRFGEGPVRRLPRREKCKSRIKPRTVRNDDSTIAEEIIDNATHPSDYWLDSDFSCNLTADQYAYYSGEDIDSLDWSGGNNRNLWELEKSFFGWKQQYKGCLLLIQNGYKYEAMDHDAIIVSLALKVRTTRKSGGVLTKALLPDCNLDDYLRRLTDVGLMVAVIEQTESTYSRTTSKGIIHREVTGIFTKGTFCGTHLSALNLDDSINRNGNTHSVDNIHDQNRFTLCFHEIPMDNTLDNAHKVQIHLILVDLYSGILRYDSFIDEFLRPKLLTILNHCNIVEIVCPNQKNQELSTKTSHLLNAKYSKLGHRSAVRVTGYSLKDFEPRHCSQILSECFKGKDDGFLERIQSEWNKSVTSISSMILTLSMLVHHLRICGVHQTLPSCTITKFKNAVNMKLNGTTTDNLEILRNSEGDTNGTLFEMINRGTVTSFGSRLMRQWVLNPLMAINAIKKRQNAVTEMKQLIEEESIWFVQLIGTLRRSKDLERRLRAIQCRRCSPKMFLNVMNAINEILNAFPTKQRMEVMEQIQDNLKENGLLWSLLSSVPCDTLLDVIQHFISKLNPQMTGYRDAICEQSQSEYPELMKCQKRIDQIQQTLDGILDQIRSDLELSDLYWKRVRDEWYLIEIEKHIVEEIDIPNDWRFHSETKSMIRYKPKTIDAVERTMKMEEDRLLGESKKAWLRFLDEFNTESEPFCHFISVLAQIDCLHSLGVLANSLGYVLPEFVNGEFGDISQSVASANEDSKEQEYGQVLVIKGGRHPVLEEHVADGVGLQWRGNVPSECIANDIELSSQSGCRQMVISGPNMGGKSVFIKMVGVLVIMAQIGSYVPAESMRLTPFDMVGTRMGARDDIVNGKSTFFIEMTETSDLLATATKRSLLMLDELGRGTSTFDGTAMAYGVLKYIVEDIGCMTLFVTHYNELLGMKQEFPECVSNFYMDFRHRSRDKSDNTSNTSGVDFLYKIKEGECEQSYGIEVARLAGMDETLVKRARTYANEMIQNVKRSNRGQGLSFENVILSSFSTLATREENS